MITKSMHGKVSFTCVLLFISYFLSEAFAQSTPKTAILEQAKSTLASLLDRLDEIGKDLSRKKAAHSLLSGYISNSTPEPFVRALSLEVAVLGQLIEANNLIGGQISAANQLAGGHVPNSNFS